MTDPARLIATDVCKKGLDLIVSDIYTLLKNAASEQLQQWRVSRSIDDLYKKMAVVRNIKTILQVKKEVDLATFYYATKVETQTGGKSEIHDLDDLGYSGNILFSGTVGQGKSIFFRYLTVRELAKGKAIPVFVELRRLQKGRALLEFLLTELRNFGLEMEEEHFHTLCEAGKLVLFLDGFDEVAESDRLTVLSQIEDLWKRHKDKLRIYLSSRPNTGAEGSSAFQVSQLAPLSHDDYPRLIARFIDDPKRARQLTKEVQESAIAPVLTTPLMVALLVVRFHVEQTIPANEIEFYEDLFMLLIRRHDQYKGAYRRDRKSQIGDSDLLRIFCAICYLARATDATGEVSRADLCEMARKAATLLVIKANPDHVVDDIVRRTNLIIEESGDCRFVHKSVAEYHAARFVSGVETERAMRFYTAAATRITHWQPELAYLVEMDTRRALTHFAIPVMREHIQVGEQTLRNRDTVRDLVHVRAWVYQMRALLPIFRWTKTCRARVDLTQHSASGSARAGTEIRLRGITRLIPRIIQDLRGRLHEAEDIVEKYAATDPMFDEILP